MQRSVAYLLFEFKEGVLRANLLLWKWEWRTFILLVGAFSILGITIDIISLLSTVLHEAVNLVLKVSMSCFKLGLSLQILAYLE